MNVYNKRSKCKNEKGDSFCEKVQRRLIIATPVIVKVRGEYMSQSGLCTHH